MKHALKILIGISILILCLNITVLSAADNETIVKSMDENGIALPSEENDFPLEKTTSDMALSESQDNYEITAKNFHNNDRIEIDKNFKYIISKMDVDDAKNTTNGILIKKDPNVKVKVFKPVKVTVKEKVYKKVKVKTTKKFTCWHLTKKSLKMDKKYLKYYYKYQAQGYKIDNGKWVKTRNGWKCIFTATKIKKVNKWTGKYKTRKVTQYKSKTLKGIQIQICGDGVVYICPDFTGYRNYVYKTGYAIPGLCTVGQGTYI